ncbi:DNA adenine methylase [Candidatus Mycoplasma pogonae]
MIQKINKDLKPFFKWNGGLMRWAKTLHQYIPETFNTYLEPFLGSGVMLLQIQPHKAIVNDVNRELIATWKQFYEKPYAVIHGLERLLKKHSETHYYQVRQLRNELLKNEKQYRADYFLYLNITGYGRLYRVNSKGLFNNPVAKVLLKRKTQRNLDYKKFASVAKYLKDSEMEFLNTNYKNVLTKAKPGDFVFIDTPYDFSDDEDMNWVMKKQLNTKELITLFNEIKALNNQGVKVMFVNKNSSLVQKIFADFNFYPLPESESDEVIITNYVVANAKN